MEEEEGGGGSILCSWGTTHCFLPPDIVFIILSYLPLKSLARFRCICKLWYGIIDNTLFAQTHFSYSRAPELIALVQSPHPKMLVYAAKEDGDMVKVSKEPIFELERSSTYRLEGSCQGLLYCVDRTKSGANKPASRKGVVVFNPFARLGRAFIELPCPQTESFIDPFDAYGLGCDDSTGMLKLVRVFQRGYAPRIFPNDQLIMGCVYLAEVHVLGTDSWREISGPLHHLPTGQPIFLDGYLYWETKDLDPTSPSGPVVYITCFDVAKEKFTFLPTPNLVEPKMFHLVDLWKYVSAIDLISKNEIQIMCLQDHNLNGAVKWGTVKSRIVMPEPIKDINTRFNKVLGPVGRDAVLLMWNGKYYCYNFMSEQLKRIKIDNEQVLPFELYFLTGSLFPLPWYRKSQYKRGYAPEPLKILEEDESDTEDKVQERQSVGVDEDRINDILSYLRLDRGED